MTEWEVARVRDLRLSDQQWWRSAIFGVPTLADAIFDGVIHNAYRIDLAGESLRKRRSSP